jgi:hypothetical protein
MRHSIDPRRDFTRLTPCAARLAELLCIKLPEINALGRIKPIVLKHEEARDELDLLSPSPSGKLILQLLTSREGVEIRFEEKGRRGRTTAVFSMHPLNFHRTCEAAVDFIEKIANGQIIVARENKRSFPLVGPKRLRFFDVGELVGSRASSIEQVYPWHELHT